MGPVDTKALRVDGNEVFQANLSQLKRFPILMYHRVVEEIPPGPLYDIHVTRENLDKQMGFLKERGYEAITFSDILTRKVPEKPVILTFDDGYEDNHTFLLPLLKKHRMKAVVYLLGNRAISSNVWDAPLGATKAPLLKSAQIKEMAESGLVEFGAHSMTHARLTQLPPKKAEKEIKGCKRTLEKFLGRQVLSFAYPFGFFNEDVKQRAAQAGYLFGVAVEWGPGHFREDLMEIRRVCLSPDAGKLEFAWKTSFLYPAFRHWRRRLFSRAPAKGR